MGFAFIREGDTTSHGGRVLACSPENKSDGVPLALLGDKVSCPKRRFHKNCWARRRVFQQIRQQPSLRNAS